MEKFDGIIEKHYYIKEADKNLRTSKKKECCKGYYQQNIILLAAGDVTASPSLHSCRVVTGHNLSLSCLSLSH